jgi:hypothetical protein
MTITLIKSAMKKKLPSTLLEISLLPLVLFFLAACTNAQPETAAAPLTLTREVAATWTTIPPTLPEPAEQEATAETPDAATAVLFLPLVFTPQGELIAHYFDVGQILQLRPFSSLDDMVRINGSGTARLRDIDNQGLIGAE